MKSAAKAAVRRGAGTRDQVALQVLGVDGCMARFAEVGAGRDPAEQTKTWWALQYHALTLGTGGQP
jgi:hypothetical protein